MAISECSGHNEQRAEEKRWKGHVVVVPWPAQGHINPLMHLSSHLAAHSVLVTFVNVQFAHDRILQSRVGSRKADMISEGNIRLVGIPDGLGYDEDVANFGIPKQARALKNLEPLLMKLVEDSQPPVTCIIADVLLISTPAVARQFNIPHVSFWTQSATNYSAHLFFTQNHASLKEYLKKLCDEGNVNERVIDCMPSCPAMSYKELPTFLVPCDPSNFIFSNLITTFQIAPHSTLLLMNTFEELEQESLAYIHTANMLCMGPILPSQFIFNDTTSPCGNSMTLGTSFWVEDEEGCLPWLHQQKPNSVLYISFGSITLMSISQVLEFAIGLEASGWPFLMVVRPKMMQNGGDVVFPNGFVDRMRESGRGVFVAWAPQLKILAHPAIGGFLTHAGWNSTLESICREVPMLCWPYFGDQMLNARCIVDAWKIGLDFVVEKVTNYKDFKCCRENEETGSDNDNIKVTPVLVNRKEIEQKIRQLMDPLLSTEIRKRIKSLSKGARRAYESSPLSTWKVLLDVLSRR